MIALRARNKFCPQCRMYGHAKWLFLGTHRTHRLYLRWHLRKIVRQAKRLKKERDGWWG